MPKIPSGILAGVSLALFATSGCSRAEASFGPERQVALAQRPVEFGLDQAARFGLREMGAAKGVQDPKAPAAREPFQFQVPGSWQKAQASEFRQLNFKVGDGGECYLTAGNLRGGALANVNRWVTGQFGQQALTADRYAALPRLPLLGSDAALVELEGDFRGMGAESKKGFKLLGLVGGSDDDLVTLKFTGPKELVDRERTAFLALAASLKRSGDTNASAPTVVEMPVAVGGEGGTVVVGDGHAARVPASWQARTPSQFRLLNFQVGSADCECYLTAGGLRGGLLGNANRWVASQFGQPALTEAEFAALSRHPLLGGPAALVDVTGDFRGMDGQAKTGYRLLGLLGGSDDEMVTWKMVGPADVVEREKANFLAVAASIREGEMPGDLPVSGASAGQAPAPVPPSPTTSAPSAAAPFAASIPDGWKAVGDTGSRLLYHRFGDSGECYVGQLSGEPDAMLGIWFGEFARTAPDAAGMAALPRIAMLGGEAMLLDLEGDHQGMTGQKRPGMRLLVAVRKTDAGVVFCKCIGTAADVTAHKSGFLRLCETLKRSDG